MIRRVVVACFVRTAARAPVKTRLTADIGARLATTTYRYAVAATRHTLRQLTASGVTTFWAVAEPDGVPYWRDLPAMVSGVGDLGQRLHHVYSTLQRRYDIVVLIGSDTPQLSIAIIKQAIAMVTMQTPFVIGAATDGGFYLFASNQPLSQALWLAVPYSSANTLTALQQALPQPAVCLPQQLTDIDDAQSLRQLPGQMPMECTSPQRAMLAWLQREQLVDGDLL